MWNIIEAQVTIVCAAIIACKPVFILLFSLPPFPHIRSRLSLLFRSKRKTSQSHQFFDSQDSDLFPRFGFGFGFGVGVGLPKTKTGTKTETKTETKTKTKTHTALARSGHPLHESSTTTMASSTTTQTSPNGVPEVNGGPRHAEIDE